MFRVSEILGPDFMVFGPGLGVGGLRALEPQAHS